MKNDRIVTQRLQEGAETGFQLSFKTIPEDFFSNQGPNPMNDLQACDFKMLLYSQACEYKWILNHFKSLGLPSHSTHIGLLQSSFTNKH